MDLTPEQQAQQAQLDIQTTLENLRHVNQLELESRRIKLEAVRLAKEVLVENARSKPVDSREITVDDIKNFANTLTNHINS